MGKAYEQRAHQKVKIQRFLNIQKDIQDFPGGPVVKSLPSSAGDAGLIPGRGTKILHVAAIKPMHSNYWVHTLWSLCHN